MKNYDVLSEITDLKKNFSNAEERIGKNILSDPEWAINGTISELAAKSGVSIATVSRFCKKLGLDSFQELKLELMRSVASVHAESKNEDQWIDEENNWQQIMAKMGACYQQAIAKTMEGIDTHRLSEICDKIVEADSVCLVGSGDMHTVATAAHIQFLQASGKFCCYNDMAVLEVAIRHMNEKSVVVFFSYTGEVSETVEIARLARERGAYIVTVTRFKDSTLASLSDGVLLCEIHKADYQFTSVPILAGFRFAADLLYVGYRQKSKTEIADF